MANRRMISGDLFEDDFIGSINYFERLLWIGMITSVADDQGRMMDNPAVIRTKVFLYDKTKDSDVENALNKIGAANKIVRYVAGGKSLIQIVNWWKYQTPAWASPSKYLAPSGWTDRAKYHAAGNKILTVNWDNIGGYVVNYVPGKDRPIEDGEGKGEGEGDIPPDPFDQIQSAVEKRGILLSGKDDTEAIQEIIKMGATVADVINGLEWKICNNSGKPVRYVGSIIGPTKTAMQKRLQNGNGHAPAVPNVPVTYHVDFGDGIIVDKTL